MDEGGGRKKKKSSLHSLFSQGDRLKFKMLGVKVLRFIFPGCASRDGTLTISLASTTPPYSSIQLHCGTDALVGVLWAE